MTDQEQRELLDAHNAYRQSGWRPRGELTIDPLLTQAAQGHADHMLAVRRMSHTGKNRSTLASRVKQTGYVYSRVAENVAAGQTDVSSVMRAWTRSRGHRHNILGNVLHVGFGRAGNYWCVVFAMPR